MTEGKLALHGGQGSRLSESGDRIPGKEHTGLACAQGGLRAGERGVSWEGCGKYNEDPGLILTSDSHGRDVSVKESSLHQSLKAIQTSGKGRSPTASETTVQQCIGKAGLGLEAHGCLWLVGPCFVFF